MIETPAKAMRLLTPHGGRALQLRGPIRHASVLEGLAISRQGQLLRRALHTSRPNASAAPSQLEDPTNTMSQLLAQDASSRLDRLGELLVAGGDTRCVIVPSTGNNAYHCPPLPVAGQIIRGSCTGSPPCAEGVSAALAALEELEDAHASTTAAEFELFFDDALESVRTRLCAALSLPEP